MAPSPGNTPLVIGLAERAQRELIIGNMYAIFMHGQRYIGTFQGEFGSGRIVLQVVQHTCFGTMITNMLPRKAWVYELNESITAQN